MPRFFSRLILIASWLATSSPQALAQPPLPEGTLPLYVWDPVYPVKPGEPQGFACFLSCGASCDCVGRVDGTMETHVEGQRCTWRTVSCLTHSFCRWHDTCYRNCDIAFPSLLRTGSRVACRRSCDAACVSGDDPRPVGGWRDPTLDPGPPPERLGAVQCMKRLAWDPSVPYDGRLIYASLVGCVPR